MSSKLKLDGSETLDEIQSLMQELKIVETRLLGTRESGDHESVGGNELRKVFATNPIDLLSDSDYNFLDKYSFSDVPDKGELSVPGKNITEYPSDFPNMVVLSTRLLAVKKNLINFVKAQINEESLTQYFFKEDSVKLDQSPEGSLNEKKHTPPRRKDSYTIHRFDKTVPTESSSDALYFPSPDVRNSNAFNALPQTSTPMRERKEPSYCTNTYSKKSSPFSSSRQLSELTFGVNGNLSSHETQSPPRYDTTQPPVVVPNQNVTHKPNMNITCVVGHPLTDVANTGSPRQDIHEPPTKLTNLSMEEIQCLARQQQESLLSVGISDKHVGKPVNPWHDHMTKSTEEDDGSGSTGNDTYSVSISNPPSETSSGISSPPAGSLEDIQVDPLRRSMPNLATRAHLSLAPTYTSNLQREAYYNSDLRLSQSRSKSKLLQSQNHPEAPLIADSDTKYYRAEPNNMEPLKRALARANTYLHTEGISADDGGSANRYATYQVSKGANKPNIFGKASRIPGPRNSFGYGMGSTGAPHVDSADDRYKSSTTTKQYSSGTYRLQDRHPSTGN